MYYIVCRYISHKSALFRKKVSVTLLNYKVFCPNKSCSYTYLLFQSCDVLFSIQTGENSPEICFSFLWPLTWQRFVPCPVYKILSPFQHIWELFLFIKTWKSFELLGCSCFPSGVAEGTLLFMKPLHCMQCIELTSVHFNFNNTSIMKTL